MTRAHRKKIVLGEGIYGQIKVTHAIIGVCVYREDNTIENLNPCAPEPGQRVRLYAEILEPKKGKK